MTTEQERGADGQALHEARGEACTLYAGRPISWANLAAFAASEYCGHEDAQRHIDADIAAAAVLRRRWEAEALSEEAVERALQAWYRFRNHGTGDNMRTAISAALGPAESEGK